MLTSEDATMVELSGKATGFCPVPHAKKIKKAKESAVTEVPVHHSFNYPMHILMTIDDPAPKACTKLCTIQYRK